MFEDLLNLLSGKRNATAQPQGMRASGAVQKALSQPLQKMPARPMQGMAPMAQPPQGWQGGTIPQRQAAPQYGPGRQAAGQGVWGPYGVEDSNALMGRGQPFIPQANVYEDMIDQGVTPHMDPRFYGYPADDTARRRRY